MHRAAFAWAGINGDYQAVQVAAAELPRMITRLRQPQVIGANLSLPHKEAVLPLLDSLSPAARAIGAVNTIIQRDGQLIGENTDAPGFLAALADAHAPEGGISDGISVVLGAGGAARAAVYALLSQGRTVRVVNRTPDKAVQLCRELGGQAATPQNVPWSEVALLVNASSAGLNDPTTSPLPDLPCLARSALVYDMVYKPAETRLMQDARALGLRAENGLGMLAWQARLAFAAWTGVNVPIEVFLGALGSALSGPGEPHGLGEQRRP